VDSRTYLFIYALKTSADLPSDFRPRMGDLSFDTGVFLPQDDSTWFTRPPKYPARLLLLGGRSLYIVPHPTSEQPLVELKLDELVQLETGGALLRGWIRFTGKAGVHELIYNTRASRPLEQFLVILKGRWLGKFSQKPNAPARLYGDDLDIKFKYSIEYELLETEIPAVQYFQAPIAFEKLFLFFKREQSQPGNLILLTSANRLVWITDGFRGRRELYAISSFSIPIHAFRSWRIEQVESDYFLELSFNMGLRWRVLVRQSSEHFGKELDQLARSNAAFVTRAISSA
jgi:hypothetical protein